MSAPEKITLSGLSRGELETLAERLLNEGQSTFLDEARDVLRAGLAAASWISVDDPGARHQHRNVVCTQLGNEHFAAFATTTSKSRLNFLEVLRAGFADYVLNAEALRDLAEAGSGNEGE